MTSFNTIIDCNSSARTLANLLKMTDEIRNYILSCRSFLGAAYRSKKGWVDYHFIISGADREFRFRRLKQNMPRQKLLEEKYYSITYEDKLFLPQIRRVDDKQVEVYGNGYRIRPYLEIDANYLYGSLLLSDYYYKNKIKTNEPCINNTIEANEELQSQEINLEDALEELNSLIGMDEVKADVHKLINFAKVQKIRKDKGMNPLSISNHIVFTGNPGTGKTTVARIIGKLLYAMDILKKPDVVEVSRADLVGEVVGATAIKTSKAIEKAMGGILFIDEAYTLAVEGVTADYGREAIDTLLKAMEDNRDNLVVIVAGYKKEMRRFIKSNPGLESRFARYIHFDDYTGDELLSILHVMCDDNRMVIDDDLDCRLENHFSSLYKKRDNTFSNGRLVRNIYENALKNQAERISNLTELSREDTLLTTLSASDFELEQEMTEDEVLLEAFSDLDKLIGMENVKEQVRSLVDYIRVNQIRQRMGMVGTPISLHTVFTGNPGTGKTTVARLLGRIYKAIGITKTATVTEVSRADLVSCYSGKTAEKTLEVIDIAKGGILFIDEAYTLAPTAGSDGRGQEAIDTLLKAMEDYRDNLIVIVAGYKNEMCKFLKSNPGLESRFAREVHFEDYNGTELFEILEGMCEDGEWQIEDSSVARVKAYMNMLYSMRGEEFANGRTVRNMYEEAIVNASKRIMKKLQDVRSKEELSILKAEDFRFAVAS